MTSHLVLMPTALIGHLLKQGGRRIEVGGNLGAPVLELAPLCLDGTYVLELSSFQLDLLHTPCLDVAVLLNIAPAHLERHGNLDGYIAVKRGIFDLLREGATAVIGIDDPHCRAIRDGLGDGLAVVPISATQTLAMGVSAVDGTLNEHLGAAVGFLATILFQDFGTGVPLIVVVLVGGGVYYSFYFGWLSLRGFKHSIDVIRLISLSSMCGCLLTC